ncbi:putative NBD/HSP70 family sugar kinase [Agromyces terreus]|uniref:NBD/HSP70 family sugar kinase n=1 Tax=Agromyces terreus TaxID=424795 RepID=A0A9X2GZ63_9MICO|nr:putative NBD/HSP70 family sugar kinase [Agromyces terreus]
MTNVAAELLEAGLITEVAPENRGTQLGRPTTRLQLTPAEHFVLAVQIGAGVLQVGVVDLTSHVVGSELTDFALPATPEAVMGLAVVMLRRVMGSAGVGMHQVVGLGVGAAGLVDQEQRINLNSQNLGWADVAMADYFERELGVDVLVDHNVRAMAAGEAQYGVGRGLESLVFVYVRTGIGAGLILGGREYRGGTHGAAEIGHMRVEPQGRECNCGGIGCFETVLSDRVIPARMVEEGLLVKLPEPNDRTWPAALVAAVQRDEPRAIALRDEIVQYTASSLLNIINLLNPQVIVLGGLLHDLAPIILDDLRSSIPPQVLPRLRDSIRIEPASFGTEAGMIGAATVALDRFVFGEHVLQTTR